MIRSPQNIRRSPAPRPVPPAVALLLALAAPAWGQDISVQGDETRTQAESATADIFVGTEAAAAAGTSTLNVNNSAVVTLDPDGDGGQVLVGQSGRSGNVMIRDGGAIVSSTANGGADDTVRLGVGAGSAGSLEVIGERSRFESAGTVDVGSLGGFGDLVVREGATATLATVNAGASSIGEITVNGSGAAAGATRLTADTIRLGATSSGDIFAIEQGGLGVSGGGAVEVGVLDVGVRGEAGVPAGFGNVFVGGENSRIDVGALRIGDAGGGGIGNVDVRDGGLIVLTGSPNVAFESAIADGGTLDLRDGGVFRNESRLAVSAGGTIDLNAGGVLENGGAVIVETVDPASGLIAGAINFDGGTLAGDGGVFEGDVTLGSGDSVVVAPGAAGTGELGSLEFVGDIDVQNGASVTFDAQGLVDGLGNAASDIVVLAGSLAFGDTANLVVNFANAGGFDEAVDTAWTIARVMGDIDGTPNFSLLTSGFGVPNDRFSISFENLGTEGTGVNVNYSANISPVPEPASMVLFSLIAAGGGAGAWRRKRRAGAAA